MQTDKKGMMRQRKDNMPEKIPDEYSLPPSGADVDCPACRSKTGDGRSVSLNRRTEGGGI